MASERRHLQHVKTEMKEYGLISYNEIPINTSSSDLATGTSVPTPTDIAHTNNPKPYFLCTSNGTYYKLSGKQPRPTDLEFGEIAVAYANGCERLFIRNSANNIVEFIPYQPVTSNLKMCILYNDEPGEPNGGYTIVSIPYQKIIDAGVNPVLPSIAAVRRRDTNTQISNVTITFIDDDEKVDIAIPTEEPVPEKDIMLILVGSPYCG